MPTKTRRRVRLRVNGWTLTVAALLAFAAYRWVIAHPTLALSAVTALAVAGIAFGVTHSRLPRPRRRFAMQGDPHRMNPTEFEEFLAELCVRDGCTRVQVVGGANDHGADVLYWDPHGQPGLIQAKRYAPGNSVGNEHVQIVNGTYRDAHGCAHAAIVTTSHFTQAAHAFAGRVGIALLDSDRLDAWTRGNTHAAPWN